MGQSKYFAESIQKTAAMLVEEAVKSGTKAHHLAQKKIEECQSAADTECMRFWRDVWIYIMSKDPMTGIPIEQKLADRSDEAEG